MVRNPTETKRKILNVSRTLFSGHGCEGTTLEDIITACGITKGAFYHYFKSKESLCESVLDEVIIDYHALVESIDEGLEPAEQLAQMIRRLSELNASGEWVNCRLILRVSAVDHESHPKIQNKLKEFWDWLESYYEGLIRQSQNMNRLSSKYDAKNVAGLLMSVTAGAITLEKALPSRAGFDELLEIVMDSLRL